MNKMFSDSARRIRLAAYTASAALWIFGIIALVLRHPIIAAAEIIAGTILWACVIWLNHAKGEELAAYIKSAAEKSGEISGDMLTSVPIPMVVCAVDGRIKWYNDHFSDIFASRLQSDMLDECISELKWSEVLKFPKGKVLTVNMGESIFALTWRMIKDKPKEGEGEQFSVIVYLRDITTEKQLKDAYTNERIDIAIINIDNYDDFLQREDDDAAEAAASKIRAALAAWAKTGEAVLKKTDRDRYFAIFEHQYLKRYTDSNFDVIKKIADIAAEVKFPLSLSIGIGTGATVTENEISARNALDLSLGRGGGQACVKDAMQFKFYGGKTGEYERSTRVKARAVAGALSDFIAGSDNVIFMGHRGADFDCFGAAVGLQRAVREKGKTPYIVHDSVSPAVDSMYNALLNSGEYNGMFIDEYEAPDRATKDTLLVVLDTHRPSMLPCPQLLDRVKRVIVIDHHRRSTEFISPCALIYHEPYASSTCELVTELLEYMGVGASVTKLEAQCLYSGIILDTKNFMLKTGVRTFEAASYLRKLGLDTVAVKRMFSTSKESYIIKAEIVKSAVMVSDNIAVAKTYTPDKNMRQIASQAADDMLNIENVVAAVVVYPADGGTGFSARSIGTVNVQLIMERLGGGGHMTVSGAFIKGIGVDEGANRAAAAVREYIEDIKN